MLKDWTRPRANDHWKDTYHFKRLRRCYANTIGNKLVKSTNFFRKITKKNQFCEFQASKFSIASKNAKTTMQNILRRVFKLMLARI